MRRRRFLQLATAAAVTPSWVLAQDRTGIDLRDCAVVLSSAASARESKAAQVLIEEAAKRCSITWPVGSSRKTNARVTIYLATRQSAVKLPKRNLVPESMVRGLQPDGFLLHSGQDSEGTWIAVLGADERGLLFGVGKLLRLIDFGRQQASVPASQLHLTSHPDYKLRGQQLSYRPKTNAYDAWTTEMWDQYIRELAIFGNNAIELVPHHFDDFPDSPHYLLSPAQMAVEMSRIADSYGLDVWLWYPAMSHIYNGHGPLYGPGGVHVDYSNPQTVESAVQQWGETLRALPRVDALFVPGGDPGDAEPKYLLALAEKQKQNLNRYHPNAQVWVSPQGFNSAWMAEFIDILKQPHTETWLDGVVFGPQMRISPEEFRRAVPQRYPIRFYPDITHSIDCQYPVPDWDVAYALTEGREIINPRPESEANILRRFLPQTIGFITYSEGCNDDVNKFVWSSLAWDSDQSIVAVLRDFSHYFIGAQQEDGFAQGLLNLERNWRGSLATNEHVGITLAGFQDMERSAPPDVIENWRWQQALYRAYYDAYVRQRLLEETGQLDRARDLLSRVWQVGWSSIPLHIGATPAEFPANGLNPQALLDAAEQILQESLVQPAGAVLRSRVTELGDALFQSIRMQLAVERYQGESVDRGANLDTLDTPVSDIPWLRRQIAEIRNIAGLEKQIQAIRELLSRTDPGPGGFYDALGNVANRPHLVLGSGSFKDPGFRHTPLISFRYPDMLQDKAPMAWKCWAESLYDAAVELRYEGLDPKLEYRVRVVYPAIGRFKIRLVANDTTEIHPYIGGIPPGERHTRRALLPTPQEFSIPRETTAGGELKLAWTREPGLGGDGGGCAVAEVWLIQTPIANPS